MNRSVYLLFLIIFGFFAYLLAVNIHSGPDPVDLLPGDTLVVVETTALSRILAPWRQGTLSVETLLHNRLSDLKEFTGAAARIAELQPVASLVGQMADAPFSERLFTGKVVVALLPDHAKRSLDTKTVSANLVLLVHLHTDFAVIPFLEDSLGSGPPEVSLYQGKSLFSLPLASGETLTIWQHRRVLVAALDPTPVRRCIDGAFDGMVRPRTSGLRLNREYQELKHRAGSRTDFFLYADLAALRSHVANAWLDERYQEDSCPNHAAAFHRVNAGDNRLTVVVRLCPELIDGLMTTYRLAAPVANPISVRLSPENLLAFWTNWFSPQLLLELISRSQRLEIAMSMLSQDQALAERTGKAGAAFFDVFGNRFGVFIDQESFAGSKQAVVGLFLEVRDRGLAEAFVQRFLAGLPVQTVAADDMEIVSLVMANGLFQPSYLLKDSVLLVADNPDLMQQMLQRWQEVVDGGQGGIGTNGRPVNIFLTFQIGKLISDLHSMLAVILKKAENQPSIMSARTRLLLGHLVMPLFSGLQVTEVCTLQASVDSGEILVEMDWTLDRANNQ